MTNMNNIINASVQIVPKCDQDKFYPSIDAAIHVIQESGLRYKVSPMETVIEGTYNEVMSVIKDAQEASLDAGATDLAVNIRLHIRNNEDVSFEEKTDSFKD